MAAVRLREREEADARHGECDAGCEQREARGRQPLVLAEDEAAAHGEQQHDAGEVDGHRERRAAVAQRHVEHVQLRRRAEDEPDDGEPG